MAKETIEEKYKREYKECLKLIGNLTEKQLSAIVEVLRVF